MKHLFRSEMNAWFNNGALDDMVFSLPQEGSEEEKRMVSSPLYHK